LSSGGFTRPCGSGAAEKHFGTLLREIGRGEDERYERPRTVTDDALDEIGNGSSLEDVAEIRYDSPLERHRFIQAIEQPARAVVDLPIPALSLARPGLTANTAGRSSDDPDATLRAFLDATYRHCADAAGYVSGHPRL
jgi:hypothetical protein